MADPYSTLGVSKSDSDESIKAAYKELAVKYAPENYADNPLSDLAAGKMTEINQAYDMIMSERKLAASSAKASSSSGSASSGFADVRNLLKANRIEEAESMLLKTDNSRRDAEWNFLMGKVSYAKGWLDEAFNYYTAATQIEPANAEYSSALNELNQRRSGRAAGSPFGQGGYNAYPDANANCASCDPCTSLLCANCLCNCMTGGRGGCC